MVEVKADLRAAGALPISGKGRGLGGPLVESGCTPLGTVHREDPRGQQACTSLWSASMTISPICDGAAPAESRSLVVVVYDDELAVRLESVGDEC